MRGTSWLQRTGQAWKLNLALALVLIALGLQVSASKWPGLPYGESIRLGVMVLSLGWFVFGFRCERCGRRVIYQMMKTEPFSRFTEKLVCSGNCPGCGFDPAR